VIGEDLPPLPQP